MKKTKRASIAQETVKIIKEGYYFSEEGTQINISHDIKQCQANTTLYSPDEFDKQAISTQFVPQTTEIEVYNDTSLSVARQMVNEGKYQHVVCLNFASAKNPGGGFLGGSQAQEESLARSSALYGSLLKMKEYYEYNRKGKSCLYSDYMIFSPNVPVFRDDAGKLLQQPYLLSFITAPAVNAGAVRKNEPNNVDKIKSVMISRAEKVLSVVAYHHCDALILGAWGCGVFRNDPVDVAEMWFTLLKENDLFVNRFKKVSFAVIDGQKRGIYQTFVDQFGG